MDGKKRQSVGSTDLPSNLAHRVLVNEDIAQHIPDEAPKSPSTKGPKNPASKAPKSPTHERKVSQGAQKPSGKVAPPAGEQKAAPKFAPASNELPDFIIQRNELFAKLKQEYDEQVKARPKEDIKVVLDMGVEGEQYIVARAWETTPGHLLKNVSKEISSNVVIAKVDQKELWDLDRSLERDCKVTFLPFDSREGKEVFWHSSAHVLGEAAECEFNGCHLSHGPPTLQGFFYDMALEEGRVVKEADWLPLNIRASKIFKEKQPFERLDVSKENLRKMFGYSKYKMHYIENLVEGESSTVYRCGTLVDLCRGPHIQNTNKIKAFEINKNSSAYFLGDPNGDSLQRIYGVAFPDKKSLAEHKKYLEEAAKRDHRKLGTEQELFMFDEVAPGCAFLLPNGVIIFNAIQKMIRAEYHKRGYQEVQSPNMYDSALWKTSGHWQYYQEDMFRLEIEKRTWGLKPMNCPGHCKIFGHRERSYRELPIRMADFGVLHRNEASGALHGLTRVRKFQQDDTHIFCTQDQITQEIEGLFDFLTAVYSLFGFPFKLKLATRPEKFLGNIATWDLAESRLRDALDKFKASGGGDWELNEGDGAFYGPKIDITISDALKRDHQCATIQLDFQLPQNFKLEYMTAEKSTKKGEAEAQPSPESPPNPNEPGPGRARPVMIHRAIIGSFERFLAIIIEHFAGKWPFWLSPRQILVIPVMPAVNDYVEEVQRIFRAEKMHVDIDISGNTMQKKIRRGQLEQYNFIFVVGAQEKETRTVNIRNRDDPNTQSKGDLIPLDEARAKLKALKKERRLKNEI